MVHSWTICLLASQHAGRWNKDSGKSDECSKGNIRTGGSCRENGRTWPRANERRVYYQIREHPCKRDRHNQPYLPFTPRETGLSQVHVPTCIRVSLRRTSNNRDCKRVLNGRYFAKPFNRGNHSASKPNEVGFMPIFPPHRAQKELLSIHPSQDLILPPSSLPVLLHPQLSAMLHRTTPTPDENITALGLTFVPRFNISDL